MVHGPPVLTRDNGRISRVRSPDDGPEEGLVAISEPLAPARLEQLAEQAGRYVDAARAEATLRAYRSDLAEFDAWADHRGAPTPPPDLVPWRH